MLYNVTLNHKDIVARLAWFRGKEFLACHKEGGFMLKITGLNKLQKELKEAEQALSELDGELGVVNFDPDDPASIEAAIQSVMRVIDSRIEPYADNPIVGSLADQMKESYRENILQKAAEARLQSDEDE
ncbi:hypothetical protein [Halomonas shengliensis]|uniref:hypothetical protein n=1 Tax=Halomonas shengliensis TaxID=419597 RepID=UPI000B0443FE|nr:hypothetical protein [Halomonas shengliensis]